MSKIYEVNGKMIELSDDEAKLLDKIAQLTIEEKLKVMEKIKSLIAERKSADGRSEI